MWWLREPTIMHSYAWIEEAFSPEQLAALKKLSLTLPIEDGTVGSSRRVDHKMRSVKVQMIDEKKAENINLLQHMTRLVDRFNEDFFQFDLDMLSTLQITTYCAKDEGHYDWHVDSPLEAHSVHHRKLSIVMLLSPKENFEGGDLLLRAGGKEYNLSKKMERGTMIAFPSHLEHKVNPITKGERRVLVTWVTGPKWR